jgi:hypothetical protein
MRTLKLAIAGAVVAVMSLLVAVPASAEINEKRYRECLAQGLATRYCCETAGGWWGPGKRPDGSATYVCYRDKPKGAGPRPAQGGVYEEPKFIQIASTIHGGEVLLYALDASGDVWRFDDKTRQWVMLPRDRR